MRHGVVACALAAALASVGPVTSAGQPPTPAGGTFDPELTRLFTPEAAPADAYEAWLSDEPIDALAARLAALDPEPLADAWTVQFAEPGAVFTAGPYDRGKLARLYVGRRLSVARGALRTPDGMLAFTLVSPWPDTSLQRLHTGTLVIVLRIAALLGSTQQPGRTTAPPPNLTEGTSI